MIKKWGDWIPAAKALSGGNMLVAIDTVIVPGLYKMGLLVRSYIIQGVKANEFMNPPNSEITIAIKGSSLPLVDNGDLVGSVVVDKKSDLEIFVGIPRNASKKGKPIYNIATIMEYGSTTGVNLSTDTGRRVMRAVMYKLRKAGSDINMGDKAGKKAGFIYSPPRPFVAPAIKKAEPALERQAQLLGVTFVKKLTGF